MNILAVDDERLALERLCAAVQESQPNASVTGFRSPTDALRFAQQTPCDIAFVDVEMREMDGVSLAQELKMLNPQINIIFSTGYEDYTGDAMSLHASGYLLKPITAEKVTEEIADLRHPVVRSENKRIRVQCFGNFDVFADGVSLRFKRSGTKELFAYLVDRNGAGSTMGDVMGILWEDKQDSLAQRSQLRNLIADLRATLRTYDAEDIVVKSRNEIAINPGRIDCDYYRFLHGDLTAVNLYRGEYMSQYSWAEMRLSSLTQP